MPAADPVTSYARRVVRGRVAVGRYHGLACARHLRDLDARTTKGWRWDRQAAADALAFFGLLRHWKGPLAGQPLTLDPFGAFIIGAICGWKRTDGLRRFRTAFEEEPRGNGKSTRLAGLTLWLGFFDGEAGAENYSIATKRDQARIIFENARQMVTRSPGLGRRLHVGAHNIHRVESASKFEPLSSDANTIDGLRPHIVTVDEVHAHKDAQLINLMMTGMGTRLQPLMHEITTAGVNRHGPWWAHREYTRLVLEGEVEDEAWFGLIAGADPDDDWTDARIHAKANPNLGNSISPDFLASECRKAQKMPIYQNDFRRLYVGQLVEQQDRVIPWGAWQACASSEIDWTVLRRRPCYGGLDLATTRDLSALVLVWPLDDGRLVVRPWFWVPRENVRDRSEHDRVPYDQWMHAGWLRVTDGSVTDYAHIRRDLGAIAQEFTLGPLGYDPWNAGQLALQLEGDGLVCVEIRQSFQMLSEPTKRLIALVVDRQIVQPDHPVLTWNVDNLTVKTDASGNLRPDKSTALERIDGAVALIMALAVWLRQPKAPTYDVLIVGGQHGRPVVYSEGPHRRP
jgi:phage terminase large subunit-like protein